MINNKKDTKKIIYAYLAIAFSGIHFFGGPIPQVIFVLTVFFSFNFFHLIDKKFLLMTIAFLYVIILQGVYFKSLSLYETSSIFINSLFISYVIFLFTGKQFPKYYVKVLYIVSIISLIFYILSLLSSGFLNFISTIPRKYDFLDTSPRNNQFIIHSVSDVSDPFTGLLRHNGVFHEAGVFGLFLTIGMYFNYIYYKKIFNKYGIVFLISIISTFSTAAFIGLIILFMGYSFSLKKVKILRLPTFILLTILSVNFFINSPILYEKIEYEFYRDMSKSMYQPTGGRIYGARKSLYVLKKYPLMGRGLTPSTRVEDVSSPEFLRYGILHEFAKVGIPIAILYLYFIVKGLHIYGLMYNEQIITNFFILALFINLFSQSFAYTPVVMNFVFWGVFFGNKKGINFLRTKSIKRQIAYDKK